MTLSTCTPLWLGWLNFWILQWFFVRLALQTNNARGDTWERWCLMTCVIPLTGWTPIRYRFIGHPRFWPLTRI